MSSLPPVAPAVTKPRFTFQNGNPQFQPTPAPRPRFAMTPLGALQALGARCTRAEILTYTALELHANKDTGFCNPGRETLAVITGLPENRISKATTSLEKKGFIRKEQPDPFHVHYYILTPPETEPVEPHARFRPPLKAQPVEVARPVPPVEPAPATHATDGMNPCHQRHEQVPPAAPLTDQWTENSKEREQEPEPARPEPAPAIPLSQESLRTIKTPPPDCIPDGWLERAINFRSDLPAEQIKTSIENFLDRNRAKGLRLVDWEAELRVWLRRERAVKPHQNASTAPQTANRYAGLDAKETPLSAAVKAALAQGEERRIAMLIEAGIDPTTGSRIVQSTVATNPQPPMAAAPSQPPIFVQQFTRAQQERIIELAAGGMSLAEAKARVAGGEGRG